MPYSPKFGVVAHILISCYEISPRKTAFSIKTNIEEYSRPEQSETD
ncbi:hypothetical protein [Pseudaquidulcibacter saccharophilus]|nr:hypothetical protein [Pseudaquidulcibacter saccharophilus]